MSLKSTVLIVDDIPENLRILNGFLQKHGINTAVANSGAQALKTIARIPVDLILLDVVMPEMDGFQLCETLKGNIETKDIPVIFVTARTETDDIVTGFTKGAVDYITKPIQEKEVIARVTTHLELMKHRNHLKDLVMERTHKLSQAMAELETAKKNAETANEAKTRFLMNVNHELVTPMNGIIGIGDVLSTTALDEEQKEFMELILSSANAQLTIIYDILFFAEMETGKLSLQPDLLDIREIVDTIRNIVKIQGRQRNITSKWSVDDSIPAALSGDAKRIRQILLNIIGNAFKFTPQGQVTVSVTKASEDNTSMVLDFSVTDTGIGIPEDKMERLFKPFSQVDDSLSRPYDGLGLGLINAKQLIEMMDGDITVKSTPGQGSIFKFTIRLEKS